MKNRSLLYLLAFIEGATVMIIELAGSRMIAPAYGASFYVWALVLSVCVGGLAAGYYLGGAFSKKYTGCSFLYSLLALAGMLIIVMPLLARIAVLRLNSLPVFTGVFINGMLFLFPPVLLLGASTPLIIRQLSDDPVRGGKAAGTVYGISTLGGIAGTFWAGFYSIPQYGLVTTSVAAGLLIGIIPVLALLFSRQYAFPFAFAVIAAVCFSFFSTKDEKAHEVSVLYRSEGLLGQLLVVDMPKQYDPAKGYDRILFVNRMGQTWIDKSSGFSSWSYVNYLTVAASVLPQKPDVLLLGLGGGTVAKQLETGQEANVDAVELDPRIAMLARRMFALGDRTNIIIDDARHFIRTTQKKYDLVVFDVFKGEVPPSHALTLECFHEVKERLKPGGLVIINFNGFISGSEGRAGRALFNTLQLAGYKVKVLPTFEQEKHRNILYLASLSDIDFRTTRFKLNLNAEPIDISTLFIQPPAGDAIVLRDDMPVLEMMNFEASQSWREDYNNNYTKYFTARGVSIFK
jgi:predicted membrane-bound spermidine synthase